MTERRWWWLHADVCGSIATAYGLPRLSVHGGAVVWIGGTSHTYTPTHTTGHVASWLSYQHLHACMRAAAEAFVVMLCWSSLFLLVMLPLAHALHP